MALNAEIIKANEGLQSLSSDQINEIVTLSSNDENTVIANKTKEIYDGLDRDLKEASGLDKEINEKTYAFAKRAVGHYKGQVAESETLNKQVTDLQTKVTEYEKQIEEGSSDAALRQKLTDTESKLQQVQQQYDTLKIDFDKKGNEHSEALRLSKVNNIIDNVASSLKFKSEYPNNIQKVLLDSAKSKLDSQYTSDLIDESGKEILVFRNEKGEIARNPENKLEPYTATELLKIELKDVLHSGKKASGAGTSSNDSTVFEGLLDLSAAKNQVVADNLIEKHLLSKGLTKTGSFDSASKFQEEFTRIRSESKVAELPLA